MVGNFARTDTAQGKPHRATVTAVDAISTHALYEGWRNLPSYCDAIRPAVWSSAKGVVWDRWNGRGMMCVKGADRAQKALIL